MDEKKFDLKQVTIEQNNGKRIVLTGKDNFLVLIEKPEHIETLACCQLHTILRFWKHLLQIVKKEIAKL